MKRFYEIKIDPLTGRRFISRDVQPNFEVVRFQQSTPNAVWSIRHDGNSEDVIPEFFDDDGNVLYPTFVVVNENEAYASFGYPESGTAILIILK